jgi:hypothetical protein
MPCMGGRKSKKCVGPAQVLSEIEACDDEQLVRVLSVDLSRVHEPPCSFAVLQGLAIDQPPYVTGQQLR